MCLALSNLGSVYDLQGDYILALDYYQQSLAIAMEIGDRSGQGLVLCRWANTLIKLEQYLEAQKYLQTSLEICKEIGARNQEANALNNLAALYQKLGQHNRAVEYCEQALALATELDIPLAKECQKLKEELLTMEKEEREKGI
ncbi:MAG TPA: tetratricopeptide repeat protein [Phormidium sp.]